jgi:hypothetical protein
MEKLSNHQQPVERNLLNQPDASQRQTMEREKLERNTAFQQLDDINKKVKKNFDEITEVLNDIKHRCGEITNEKGRYIQSR